MLKIGVTGGIGSGKTTVAKVFQAFGIPVFMADVEAKRLMQEDEGLKNAIKSAFGNSIYQDGKLDKQAMAALIFNDEGALDKINSLVHPAVQLAFEKWCSKQSAKYVLKEAAILFESGADKGLDLVICVSAPDELRIQRVKARDGVTESQVEERMAKQWAKTKKIELSDYHIVNDELQLLLPQIIKVHQDILEQAR